MTPTLKKAIQSLLILLMMTTTSHANLNSGSMSAHVNNQTHHFIKVSQPWQAVYGSTAYTLNSNPIAAGKEMEVVSLQESFTQPSKYHAAYDVWDVNGNYLGNCTLEFGGYPNAFSEAFSQQYCLGPQSDKLSVDVARKKVGTFGDNGMFIFTISSSM